MGRPLKKDVRGTQVLGLPGLSTNSLAGITVSGYFGGTLSTNYVLIKQRGAQTFVVAKIENFTCDTVSGSRSLTNMGDQVEVTVGDEISGPGIPAGAIIQSLDSATAATISIAATATATGITVTHWGAFQTGTTVDTTPDANGEILIRGSTTGESEGTSANLVPIRKLTRRIAYGFPSSPVLSNGFQRSEDSNASTNHDEAKYTWYLENDSSADYIVLTAFTTKM
jgi:hypothetical protein